MESNPNEQNVIKLNKPEMETNLKPINNNLAIFREDLIKAFNQMWGNFPCPVMLVHKSHTIVAQNPSCIEAVNGSYCGQKCVKAFGGDHSTCQAQLALKEQVAKVIPFEAMGMKGRTYWVPITDETDFFLHLAITGEMAGITEPNT